MPANAREEWRERVARELADIEPLARGLGYSLEEEQPHTEGERYLMKSSKFVLVGRDAARGRVIIKASRNPEGIAEMAHEKEVRDALRGLSFAQDTLLVPRELLWGERGGYRFFVTEFIEQDRVFVLRSLEEQFFLALRAFEAQEAFHATTRGHVREIARVFDVYAADTYLQKFDGFARAVGAGGGARALTALARAGEFLAEHKTVIERYNNYLTHNDFVPHNLRVRGRELFALDYAELWFGNKYEGWARFINYMEVHNPPLARLLVEFIKTNRPAEYLCLRLMRAYKLGRVLEYHAGVLEKADGPLRELAQERVALWTAVLEHVLEDTPVPEELVGAYRAKRDMLRSEDEKKRQREFAVA